MIETAHRGGLDRGRGYGWRACQHRLHELRIIGDQQQVSAHCHLQRLYLAQARISIAPTSFESTVSTPTIPAAAICARNNLICSAGIVAAIGAASILVSRSVAD